MPFTCGGFRPNRDANGNVEEPDWSILSADAPLATYRQWEEVQYQAAAFFGVDFWDVWDNDPVFDHPSDAYDDYVQWHQTGVSKVMQENVDITLDALPFPGSFSLLSPETHFLPR